MSNEIKQQRIPAEEEFMEELNRLADFDPISPPPGWYLSPSTIEKFIIGDKKLGIETKFFAPPGVVSRVLVSLASGRGSLLLGESGTAKSRLSELLSAAISKDSSYVIQGGAIKEVRQLLYTWNQHSVSEKGFCIESLVPTPLFRAMELGKVVRFEEISRCDQPIQDAILSLLSERVISIPELPHEQSLLYAKAGFNIIATANNLDVGIKDMSAALKRRMSFEHICPIKRLEDEILVVMREVRKLNANAGLSVVLDDEIFEVLTTVFHELRTGQTCDGLTTDRLAGATMSTAEIISVAHAFCVQAHYFNNGDINLEDIAHSLIGAALKDEPADKRRLMHYFESQISTRRGKVWSALYSQRHLLR
ncbi:ATP-binding protein [Pseudoalteromonas pernae]|uniref:ATP-binding protein n=1 Tax=Pseudoalteromonas pernae TaxID=3118054 RepID=UPI0032421EEB